jgi:hypothetical protein
MRSQSTLLSDLSKVAGIYIRMFVGQQLAAQNITTPEDASIPNTPVTGIATALSMSDIISTTPPPAATA